MKKIFPVLFVVSTSLTAVVGIFCSFNNSFREIKAESNNYKITFTRSDITSKNISTSGWNEIGTFSFSKKTQSGFDFGTTATVKGADVFLDQSNYMAYVKTEDDYDDGTIQMTFEFHNVSSVVSVVLYGTIWVNGFDRSSATYTTTTQTSDGYKLTINETHQQTFQINSIEVNYTCSY